MLAVRLLSRNYKKSLAWMTGAVYFFAVAQALRGQHTGGIEYVTWTRILAGVGIMIILWIIVLTLLSSMTTHNGELAVLVVGAMASGGANASIVADLLARGYPAHSDAWNTFAFVERLGMEWFAIMLACLAANSYLTRVVKPRPQSKP
jgi:hypothetical protein